MKKVLALTITLALVLSCFTMVFADPKTSSDFSDASQINYAEAVDQMIATGIIDGYPDGTFRPQKTVKRAEMAKMIAVMLNDGKDVGNTYKNACPFADSKNHWAAGYIAYCAAEHIIDGRSADVFDPEAEVTGTEVAKMALTSLGYISQIQGYVGENWSANVLIDAKKNDLFNDLASDFVAGDPCKREAAAQILYNDSQAEKVEYEDPSSISVLGFITKVTIKSTSKGDVATVKALVDGKEVTYTTVPAADFAYNTINADSSGIEIVRTYASGDFVRLYPIPLIQELSFNSEYKLKSICNEIEQYKPNLAEPIRFPHKVGFVGGCIYDYDKKNNVLVLCDNANVLEPERSPLMKKVSFQKNEYTYEPVENAIVYRAKGSSLEKSSFEAIRNTSNSLVTSATLLQTVNGSENWDIVIIGEKPKYAVIIENSENGSVEPNVDYCTVGDDFFVIAKPADGYVLKSITCDGRALKPKAMDGIISDPIMTYWFTNMPARNVTVKATFTKEVN